jgi:hypothetical protein
VRNAVGGPSIRLLSRYVCVRGPEVDAEWNRIPARTVGPTGVTPEGNMLMLPWPLRIEAEDFKPTGAVERAVFEPYGFFEFAPGELLDLDLADRVLQSARNQEGSVEVVVLPESALSGGWTPVRGTHRAGSRVSAGSSAAWTPAWRARLAAAANQPVCTNACCRNC